jgi:hypothetical protein
MASSVWSTASVCASWLPMSVVTGWKITCRYGFSKSSVGPTPSLPSTVFGRLSRASFTTSHEGQPRGMSVQSECSANQGVKPPERRHTFSRDYPPRFSPAFFRM